MPSSHAYGFHPRQVDARRADPPGSGAGRRRRRGRGLHSHRQVGLHRGRTGARARGPGQGCDPSPDQARRHRAHADDGRVPAVLGPRPGGDVRPGTGRQDLLSDLLPVALRAARAGAAVLLESGLAHPGIAAELKGRGDYVTATDRRSESAILEVLAREAPGIAVLAEERGGARASTMGAVDPFDGFFELGLDTWDVVAGAVMVVEVGGRATDWSGGDAWIDTGDILAAAPDVHEVLLELAAQTTQG